MMGNGCGCAVFLPRQWFTVSECDEYARGPGHVRGRGLGLSKLKSIRIPRLNLALVFSRMRSGRVPRADLSLLLQYYSRISEDLRLENVDGEVSKIIER